MSEEDLSCEPQDPPNAIHNGSISFFSSGWPSAAQNLSPFSTIANEPPGYYSAFLGDSNGFVASPFGLESQQPFDFQKIQEQPRLPKRKRRKPKPMNRMRDEGESDDISLVSEREQVKVVSKRIRLMRPFEEEEKGKLIIVQVKTLSGRLINLRLPSSTTVIEVKERVEQHSGIPRASQRLIFRGKQLADAKTLKEYNLPENGGLLHLVLALRGGGDGKRDSEARERSHANYFTR